MTEFADFDIPCVCPHCDKHMDGIAAMTGDMPPGEGDVNICIDCGLISVYSAFVPGRLRLPTPEEKATFLADPGIQQALYAWLVLDRVRKSPRTL
jgi:hypothetical protein